MDQLKDIMKQAVKYRFWIAFGISLILPAIGYFLGSDPVKKKTVAEQAKIKGADSGVSPYMSPGVVNAQWPVVVNNKKETLSKDVDQAWSKLYASQTPLLNWPERVDARFRTWGRKWPEDVDKGVVQQAINDYVVDYEKAVEDTYQKVKPWNPFKGDGVVVVPDKMVLLGPAVFDVSNPPGLGQVWGAQQRLWVQGTLLDAVARINGKAKNWDEAIVKQINRIDVGSPTAQDQKSMVTGQVVEPAPAIVSGSEPAAAPVPDPSMAAGMMPGMPGGSGGATANQGEIYYIKTDSTQYTLMPIQMTAMVDQNRLPEFFVGLENSPMSIQVMEFDLVKPLTPVAKPNKDDPTSFSIAGSGMGMRGGMGMGMEGNLGVGFGAKAGGMKGGGPGSINAGGGALGMAGPMMGPGGGTSTAKGGTDARTKDRAKERLEREKARKAMTRGVDMYYNIVEVTVYGQARFYNPPPAPEAPKDSTATTPPDEPVKVEDPGAPKAADAKLAEEKASTPGTPAPATPTPPTPPADKPPTTEPSKPATELAKPAEPAKPATEPAKPAEPSKPATEPAKPADPAKPATEPAKTPDVFKADPAKTPAGDFAQVIASI